MDETEILKQILDKKIFLRNTNRELETLKTQLADMEKSNLKYRAAWKKAIELLCVDPVPMKETSRTKKQVVEFRKNYSPFQAVDKIKDKIEKLEKQIANRNKEIEDLAHKEIEGWLAKP